MEWEQKADGMRVDEKIFRERWIEMILLRWYTYNRHGLYLWLNGFLTRLRKVPFQYNTDIFSASYARDLKGFLFFFLSLFLPTDVLWTADDIASSSSRSYSMAEKDCTSHWAHKERSLSLLNHSTSHHSLYPSASLYSTASRHGLFPGICLSSGSSDVRSPTWACPGGIWYNPGPSGPWCWPGSQYLWGRVLISTPGDQ